MMTVAEFIDRLVKLPVGLEFKAIAAEVRTLPRDLRALVRRGEAEGVLEWCENDAGQTVVLTPLEASRRDLEPTWVSDAKMLWRPFGWAPPGRRRPWREGIIPDDAMSRASDGLEKLDATSRGDGPPALVISAEEGAKLVAAAEAAVKEVGGSKAHVQASRFPWPRRFLGSTSVWDGPSKGRCPVCSGRRLGPLDYCLACDRAGIDYMLPRIIVVPDKPAPGTSPPFGRALNRERRKAMAKKPRPSASA